MVNSGSDEEDNASLDDDGNVNFEEDFFRLLLLIGMSIIQSFYPNSI